MTATDNHISDLKPDPRNARRHNPRNVGQIVNAMHEVGAARSIVIDEDNVILAGNATIEAAGQAGIERLRIIDADGEEIIAVRRSGLTADQKARLAIADNRTAELAEWDTDVLAELLEDGVDLTAFWHDWELASIIGGEANDPNAEWVGMPEFEQDDQSAAYKCIVNFASTEDMEAFERLVGQSIPRNTRSIWHPKVERQNVRDMGYVADGT